jgi:hypothetical protein
MSAPVRLERYSDHGNTWLRVFVSLEVDGVPGEYSCAFEMRANETDEACLARYGDDLKRRMRDAPARIRVRRAMEARSRPVFPAPLGVESTPDHA